LLYVAPIWFISKTPFFAANHRTDLIFASSGKSGAKIRQQLIGGGATQRLLDTIVSFPLARSLTKERICVARNAFRFNNRSN